MDRKAGFLSGVLILCACTDDGPGTSEETGTDTDSGSEESSDSTDSSRDTDTTSSDSTDTGSTDTDTDSTDTDSTDTGSTDTDTDSTDTDSDSTDSDTGGVSCLADEDCPQIQCESVGQCIEGSCVALPVEDGAPCDDLNLCTDSDQCSRGACVGESVSMTGPPQFELALLGCHGFVIDGANEEEAGRAVAGAGDFNGDGLHDVIVGAPFASEPIYGEGWISVVYGKANNDPVEIETLGEAGVTITGLSEVDYVGWSVDGIGDVNNDGFDDVAFGKLSEYEFEGEVYVVYGSDEPMSGTIADVGGAIPGFVISASEPDWIGWDVAGAGDVNGDGYADMVIARTGFFSPEDSLTTRAYVLFGGDALTDISTDDIQAGIGGLFLNGDDLQFGGVLHVDTGGDVNGDGFDDLIVGGNHDPDHSRTFVVFGTDQPGEIDMTNIGVGTPGFRITGTGLWDVGIAGDVDGDELDDLWVSTGYGFSDFGSESEVGAVNVVFGKQGPDTVALDTLSELDLGYRITEINLGDGLGSQVGRAGDLDGDGLDDLIVGMHHYPALGLNRAGAAAVVYGKEDSADIPLLEVFDGVGGMVFLGAQADARTGWAVSEAGDVDGDGIIDLIIGSPMWEPDPDIEKTGRSYVVFSAGLQ